MQQLDLIRDKSPKERAFEEFHKENPWVFDRLVSMCRALKARGFRRYSIWPLMGSLRYQFDLKTGGDVVTVAGGTTLRVKLNNNYTPYYSRKIMNDCPDLHGFFETRTAEADQ